MRHSRAAVRRHLPTSPFKVPEAAPPAETFVLQDLVTHDTYGLGRVIGIEADLAVLVDFGVHQRRILAPYAKLVKL